MSFSVIDCEQRTPEWFAARAGLLTATGAAAMLSTLKKGGDPAAKAELRLHLAMESVCDGPIAEDFFESDYMRRGREREADAVSAYEVVTGSLVQPVGFLRHDTLPIGCSPDGIVGDYDGGLEVKCPKKHVHWSYVLENRLPPEYAPQILHSLFVTELPWWDFVSYCPEFDGALRSLQLFRVRVFRDSQDLEGYALALQLFLGEVEAVKVALRERSAAPEEELIHA